MGDPQYPPQEMYDQGQYGGPPGPMGGPMGGGGGYGEPYYDQGMPQQGMPQQVDYGGNTYPSSSPEMPYGMDQDMPMDNMDQQHNMEN